MACKSHNMEQRGYVWVGPPGKLVRKEYWVCTNPGCGHTEQR